MTKTGAVLWITGLSGAGKTTLGRLLHSARQAKHGATVFLDGDALREVFGNDLGHTTEDRRKSAFRNARLCKMLSDQGIDTICATISMFHACREWNRQNIASYFEIYVRVPQTVLHSRDQKRLYSAAAPNVVGVDLDAELPRSPDLIVDNDGSRNPAALVEEILAKLSW